MGDVFRNITLAAAPAFVCKWLSLSGRPGQPSAWVQDRVVTLLKKEEEQGEEKEEKEEEKDNSKEKKRKRADIFYIGFLCLH